MSYLAKNLEYLLYLNRLNATQLQEQAGITQSTTTRILSGKTTNPRQNVLESYAHFFGVPVQDLMYMDLSTVPADVSNAQFLNKSISVWTEEDVLPPNMVSIDFLSNVYGSLGDGFENNDNNIETSKLWFSEKTLKECGVNPKYANAIRVIGDSMYPEISDGQVIAIDKSATRIFDGEIYAFRLLGETKVKYLFKHGDGFKAVSRNEDKLRYPDEIYTAIDIENLHIEILGQLWWKSETRRVRR